MADIPVDKAELLSVLLEAILYGFSLLMFGVTIRTLAHRRTTANRANHRILLVACMLLLLSTVHIVIAIIRTMYGLILYRDSYPGGPVAFFSSTTDWTFNSKIIVLSLQTLLGDGVILFRCFVVWKSKVVMIIPVLLWCAFAVIAVFSLVDTINTFKWVEAYYATTFSSNMLLTILLAYRIWYVDRRTSRLLEHRKSTLRPVVQIIVDSGLIYSLTVLSALICFVFKSNGQTVILDTVTPIISISFYMVIIRVGFIRETQGSDLLPLSNRSRSTGTNFSNKRRNRVPVQIVTSMERKIENVTPGDNGSWSDTKVQAIP